MQGDIIAQSINIATFANFVDTNGQAPLGQGSNQAVSGTLPVVNGGTGATTLTGPVRGNGTGAFTTGNTSLTTEVSGILPVANGGTGVGTSTGTGNTVLSNSPTLVTPTLGTPASATLTNATGLPLTSGVTGTLPVANGGTGVTTSTGTGNTVLSNSPTLVTPTLGTPASATLTNATGLPLTSGVTGTLPVVNGGTGLTSPGASGNVLVSNGTNWTSGTLPPPAWLGVGSYAILRNVGGGVSQGSTTAGSNLRYNITSGFGSNVFNSWSNCGGTYVGGGTAPPGTWQAMADAPGRTGPNCGTYYWVTSLWLRVS